MEVIFLSLENNKEYKHDNSHKTNYRTGHESSSEKSGNRGGSSSQHHKHYSHRYRSKSHSSEMERLGINEIYKKVRRGKISVMVRRLIFVALFLAIIIFVAYAIVTSEGASKNIFTINADKKNISEKYEALQDKVEELETYIEELEQRLSIYEPLNSDEVFDY